MEEKKERRKRNRQREMKEGIFLKNETNGGKLFKIIIISVLNS